MQYKNCITLSTMINIEHNFSTRQITRSKKTIYEVVQCKSLIIIVNMIKQSAKLIRKMNFDELLYLIKTDPKANYINCLKENTAVLEKEIFLIKMLFKGW